MWIKGALPFVALAIVAALVTTTMADEDEDAMSYTPADMVSLYRLVLEFTTQKLGPQIDCTTNGALCTGGSTCIGGSDCKQCICNPFDYGVRRSLLPSYISYAFSGIAQHRGYYSTSLAKCMRPVNIDSACEENLQCPSKDGTSTTSSTGNCDSTTKTCKCESGYIANSLKTHCVKSGFNQACTSNTDCSSLDFACIVGVCVCDNAKFWYTKSPTADAGSVLWTACRRGNYNEACGSSSLTARDSYCLNDGTTYLTCQNNLCKCATGSYKATSSATTGGSGEASCEQVTVGGTGCDTDGDQNGVCRNGTGSTASTTCSSGTCKCTQLNPIVSAQSLSCEGIPYNGPGCQSKTALAANQDMVMDYTLSDLTNRNNRCLGDTTQCSTTEDKCICKETHPISTSAGTCRQLYVGEAGCHIAESSFATTPAFTNDTTNNNGRCVGDAVCDLENNKCVCPQTMPYPVTDTDNNRIGCELVPVGESGCDTATTYTEAFTSTSQTNKDARCYDTINGTAVDTTECVSNVCTCKVATPRVVSDKKYCVQSGFGQTCTDDSGCMDNGGSGLKCSGTTTGSTCICDTANAWWSDADVTDKTGLNGNGACKRINLGTSGCASDDTKCETNSASVGGTATCDSSNVCVCQSGEKQYGTNFCGKEYEIGAACLTPATNNVACDGNMTCTSNVCDCTVAGTYTNQKTISGQCIHNNALTDVADGASCTHDQLTGSLKPITSLTATDYRSSGDVSTWRTEASSTGYMGTTSTSAVKRCGANSVCAPCLVTTNSPMTCKTFTTFQYSHGVRPAVGLLMIIAMAALALVSA